MMQQINLGQAANDGTGEPLRTGGQKINANFTELDTRVTAAQARASASVLSTSLGVASGVATLGANGKLPVSQLPPLAINEVFTVATQAAMLALTAERGDGAIRTDQNGQWYILTTDVPSVLANWKPINQNLGVALTAFGALTPAADTIAYFSGPATAKTTNFSAKARALLARTDSAGMLAEITAASRGANSDITSLTGLTTALSIAQGGTGGTDPASARVGLGLGTSSVLAAQASPLDVTANATMVVGAGGLLSTTQNFETGDAGWIGNRFRGWNGALATDGPPISVASYGIEVGYATNRKFAVAIGLDGDLWVAGGTAVGFQASWNKKARAGANSDITSLSGLTSITSSVVMSLPTKLATFTVATLPSASLYSGCTIMVSNAAGGAKQCTSNSTVWQITNTTTTVS